MKSNFGQLNALLEFVAYFVGTVMASGAIFGALNSLYASVDTRRREIATLRALGFGNGAMVISVLGGARPARRARRVAVVQWRRGEHSGPRVQAGHHACGGEDRDLLGDRDRPDRRLA